jgi:hypothetical protein
MSMPLVFVGSSSEQLPLVTNLLLGLEHTAVVKPWTGSFKPGETTLDALISSANQADFALFVFGPDDWTESRSERVTSPRDNVVFEAGLFGGVLGWRRSVIVHAKGVKLPSDLLGLTVIAYDPGSDPEREGMLVSAKIKKVIDELGWRGSEGLAGQLQGHWWQFTLSDAIRIEQSALSLLEIRRTGQLVTLSGKAWTVQGDLIAQFWSKATSINEESHTLFYYWEGDWPGHPDAPQFFGKGEIVREDADRASGYFTIRSEGDVDPRERKRVLYRRATAAELEVMKAGTASKRTELIRQQLEERQGLKFSGG